MFLSSLNRFSQRFPQEQIKATRTCIKLLNSAP